MKLTSKPNGMRYVAPLSLLLLAGGARTPARAAVLAAAAHDVAEQYCERKHDEDVQAEADGEFDDLVGVLEGREEDGACGGVHQFVGGVLDAKIEACCLSELLS